MKNNKKIQRSLRLQSLDSRVSAGVFDEEQRDKLIKKLENLISGALFLANDKKRRENWINTLPSLDIDDLLELEGAIMRENLRYKKGARKITFEKTGKNIDIANCFYKKTDDLRLDLTKNPEERQNSEALDNMALLLVMAIFDIFEQEGARDFKQTQLKLKITPDSFKLEQKRQKALEQIATGLQEWKGEFKKDWERFVDAVSRSFLLAKQTECEIEDKENDFPEIEADEQDLDSFLDLYQASNE